MVASDHVTRCTLSAQDFAASVNNYSEGILMVRDSVTMMDTPSGPTAGFPAASTDEEVDLRHYAGCSSVDGESFRRSP